MRLRARDLPAQHRSPATGSGAASRLPPMPLSALMFVNRAKPEAAEGTRFVRGLIERHGSVRAVLDVADEDADLPSASEVDAVVVLGGDGTLLSAVRRCRHLDRPFLGVNFGRVGFIAEFEPASLERQAEAIFARGAFRTNAIHTIRGRVFGEGASEPRLEETALNDFVVTAGPPYRMITIGVEIDGNEGPEVAGDGMIVATPLGSTAYNVSAGGPIVAPGVNANVVTPIAAHSLSFRPIVVHGDQEVRLRLANANEQNGLGTTLVVDGRVQHQLFAGDTVVLRTGEAGIRFIVDPTTNYWHTLMQKMRWAARPRGK